MITGVAGMINEMFSRSMLDWWLPENFYAGVTRKEAGGIFGACYKLCGVHELWGFRPFAMRPNRSSFRTRQDQNSPALFAKVNHYFVITGCVVLLGIGINLDIFKYFIGDIFWYWAIDRAGVIIGLFVLRHLL
jgi:hypothetical protein